MSEVIGQSRFLKHQGLRDLLADWTRDQRQMIDRAKDEGGRRYARQRLHDEHQGAYLFAMHVEGALNDTDRRAALLGKTEEDPDAVPF